MKSKWEDDTSSMDWRRVASWHPTFVLATSRSHSEVVLVWLSLGWWLRLELMLRLRTKVLGFWSENGNVHVHVLRENENENENESENADAHENVMLKMMMKNGVEEEEEMHPSLVK